MLQYPKNTASCLEHRISRLSILAGHANTISDISRHRFSDVRCALFTWMSPGTRLPATLRITCFLHKESYNFHGALSRPTQECLGRLRESDSKRIKLLEHEGGHRRRDWEAKSSILIIWQILSDHLHRIRPSADDRLSLMSFFDRQSQAGECTKEAA